jgi:predicted PurR-regulated permease PerM
MTQNFATMENWRVPILLARLAWVRTLLGLLPTPGQLFEAGIGDSGQTLLPALQTTSKSISAFLSGALIVTFMSLYLMVSSDHFERLWLSLLPTGVRQKVRGIWRRIDESLGKYGRFLASQFLLTWIVISVGSYILGSPFPVLVGLAVALTSLVPVIGIPLALVVKFFIGLLGGYTFTLQIMIFVGVVLVLMRLFVWPRMYKRQWDSPILSLIIALAFAQSVGLYWTILAPPLAAIINILWTSLVVRGKRDEEVNHIVSIKQHREALNVSLSEIEGDLPPALRSSLGKLDELLAKASPLLEE